MRDIFYGRERKPGSCLKQTINSDLSPEGSQSKRFLEVGFKASLGCRVRTGSNTPMNFLVCSLNISGDSTGCSRELFE